MKLFLLPLLAFVLSAGITLGAQSSSAAQTERVAASFVLALGRTPTAAEASAWSQNESGNVSDLIAKHRQQLQADSAQRRVVAEKACEDALGRKATEAELTGWTSEPRTYTELMKQHLAWLKDHPADYEKVLAQAYQVVVRREVYPTEIAYWKKRDTLPYLLVVGCVEDWAHRNSPGLMETTGTPTIAPYCRYLTSVSLTPSIAEEARAAAGLMPAEPFDSRSARGFTVVAVGAEQIVGAGRVHFVTAGGEGLLP